MYNMYIFIHQTKGLFFCGFYTGLNLALSSVHIGNWDRAKNSAGKNSRE